MLDGSAPEQEWVWLRRVRKGGDRWGRGQDWERGALRARGQVEQALGKLCGLEGFCGKKMRGRWLPAATAVDDEKLPLVLSWWKLSRAPEIQGNYFGSKAGMALLPLAASQAVCTTCESGRGRWSSSKGGQPRTVVSQARSGYCCGKTGIKRKSVESPDLEMHLHILWGQSLSSK